MNSSPSTCAVAPEPLGSRRLRFARQVGHYAWVQVLVQAIGFTTGILLIRSLEQSEYALFTIANAMQGTINILADIGISIGLISIGGRVWQDPHRFGELVSTGLKLRRRLGAAAILIVIPILYFMLVRNGASPFLHGGPDRCCFGGLVRATLIRGSGRRAAVAVRFSPDSKD